MTSPRILSPVLAHPLEREFEAWIVREMQDYFLHVQQPAAVWAVSPSLERTWPADEAVIFAGKLFGLQFKQAKLATGAASYSRVNWSLAQPSGQYELVQKHSELFYALPTFVSRTWSRASLHHCLFWRPPGAVVNYNAWYSNSMARTPHNNVAFDPATLRWGGLVERVVNCDEGLVVGRGFSLRDYVNQLRLEEVGTRPETVAEQPLEAERQGRSVFYLVNLAL